MPAPIRLKYHQATLDFLGRKPALSRASVKLIDAAEKKTRLRLPTAVREWYSLTWCDTIIRLPPAGIGLVSLRALLKNLQAVPDYMPYLQVGAIEGTYYHFWLALDGSDDPPVIEVDFEADRCQIIAAEHFSEFLFGLVWEGHPYLSDDALVARKHPFGPPPLDFMKEHYTEGLVHYSRCEGEFTYGDFIDLGDGDISGYTYRNYPFYNADGMVTIRCSGDPTTRQVPALWSFHAESVEALVKLVAPVWSFRGLYKALRATSGMGASALAILKGKPATG